MRYKVEWEEWVYDSHDNIESINDQEIMEIESSSIADAGVLAISLTDRALRLKRDYSKGLFVSHIISLTDALGNRYRRGERHKILNGLIVEDKG